MFSYNKISKKLPILEETYEDVESYLDSDIEEYAEQLEASHFLLLPDDALDIHLDFSIGDFQELRNQDGNKNVGSPVGEEDDYYNLKKLIDDAFKSKLPQLMEYRKKGYNTIEPDNEGIEKLEEELRELHTQNVPGVVQSFLQPVQHFLDTLKPLLKTDERPTPELQESIQQANTVIRNITDALEAIHAAGKIGSVTWEQEVDRTTRMQRKELVATTMEKLSEMEHKHLPGSNGSLFGRNEELKRGRIEGLLFSESNLLTAEYTKFKQLEKSLLADSHMTRQKLALYLETKTATILTNARDFREYAMKVLLAQEPNKQQNVEQLGHWSLNFNQYVRHIRAVDGEMDANILLGNPLIKAVRMKKKIDEPAHIKIARTMLPISDELGKIVVVLGQEKEKVQPTEEIYDKQDPNLASKLREGINQTVEQLVHLGRTKTDKTKKVLFNAKHTITGSSKAYSKRANGAIKNTALLLLDEIQQAERRIKLLPSFARELQEAVEQHASVTQHTVYNADTLPELSGLLNQQLKHEAERWLTIEQQSRNKLQELIAPVTQLAREKWEQDLYFRLNEELRKKQLGEGEWKTVQRFDEVMGKVVEKFAKLAGELDGAAVHLAAHGYSGGEELQRKVVKWLLDLNELKGVVKTGVAETTGTSIGNFSRGGMLARGMSEWAEDLKQGYLQGKHPENKEAASNLFERALMNVLEENRSHFVKKSDPEAEWFLKRLIFALKHASDNTTVYPPTAEEILAKSRSVPDDIKRWAEQKMASGAIYAALRGGFNLTVSAISLPLRIAARTGRTAVTMSKGVRAINRGVRLGQGSTAQIKNKYINQELSKAAIRLTLSMSPLVGYGIATAITSERLYSGNLNQITKQMLVDIVKELPWIGVNAGTRAAIKKYTEHSIEKAIEKAIQDALSEQVDILTSRVNDAIETAGNTRSEFRVKVDLQEEGASTSVKISTPVQEQLQSSVRRKREIAADEQTTSWFSKNESTSDVIGEAGTPHLRAKRELSSVNSTLTELTKEETRKVIAKAISDAQSSGEGVKATLTGFSLISSKKVDLIERQEGLWNYLLDSSINFKGYPSSVTKTIKKAVKNIYIDGIHADYLRILYLVIDALYVKNRGSNGDLSIYLSHAKNAVLVAITNLTGSSNPMEWIESKEQASARFSKKDEKEAIELVLLDVDARKYQKIMHTRKSMPKPYPDDYKPYLAHIDKIETEVADVGIESCIKNTWEDLKNAIKTPSVDQRSNRKKSILKIKMYHLLMLRKEFNRNEGDTIDKFDKVEKQGIYDSVLNLTLNKKGNFHHSDLLDSNGIFTNPDGSYKNTVPILIQDRLDYLKQIEPNITDEDASKILRSNLKIFLLRKASKLTHGNLQVLLNALHYLGYEYSDIGDFLSQIEGTIYSFPENFSISEEDYLSTRTKMYNEEETKTSNPTSLPFEEITSNTRLSPLALNQTILELNKALQVVSEKKVGNILSFDEDTASLNYTSMEIKSLVQYVQLINNTDLVNKIDSYIAKNNYEDIIFAADIAQEISESSDLFLDPNVQDELTSVIYQLAVEKRFTSLSLTKIHNEFLRSKKSLNPLSDTYGTPEPENYFSMDSFKISTDSPGRWDFNQQFYDYRDKYSLYDAKKTSALLLADTQVTFEEATQPPKMIKTWAVFGKELGSNSSKDEIPMDRMSRVSPQYIPGRIVLMKLSSGRYILYGNLMGQAKAITLTENHGDMIHYKMNDDSLEDFGKGWFSNEADQRFQRYHGMSRLTFVNDFIIAPLYGSFDGNQNPIKNVARKNFTLAVDSKATKINMNDSLSTANVLAQGIAISQNALVESLHQTMDDTNPILKVLRDNTPIVKTAYHFFTDSEYVIDDVDLLLDIVTLISLYNLFYTLGKTTLALANLGHNVMKAGILQGLRGAGLWNFVTRQIAPEIVSVGGKSAFLMMRSLYDLIEPIPVRAVFTGIYRGVKKGMQLASLNNVRNKVVMTTEEKSKLKFTKDNIWESDSGKTYITGDKGDFYQVKKSENNQIWIMEESNELLPVSNSGGRWGIVQDVFKKSSDVKNPSLPTNWTVDKMELDYLVPDESGIYKFRPDHPQTMQDYDYFIKQDGSFYQVKYDADNSTLRLLNPATPGRSGYAPPIRLNQNNLWEFHSDVGLKGGVGGSGGKNLLGKVKEFFAKEKRIKNQRFQDSIESAATKWPPEKINENIHMIWIGTRNISEKNIGLSIDTAKKNLNYRTDVIYDSGISGYESAKNFMLEKFKDSNVNIIDFRNKDYFSQICQEPIFKYYEQAVADKKYAQASDILRLLVLKYEGGIYKDIDDTQVKGFGSLSFPKGIGVMREYAPEASKVTAFPNTPIAVTKGNPVIDKTLTLAVENYERGEQNVLKLAGPDVFTQALYQEIPGLNPSVLNKQLDQFELAKRQALGLPLEKPKNFADEKLTLAEKEKIIRPYQSIRGLSGYVDNGADHSWAVGTAATDISTKTLASPGGSGVTDASYHSAPAGKSEQLGRSTSVPHAASTSSTADVAGTHSGKITYNLTEDIPAYGHLSALSADLDIKKAIDNPSGRCESIMKPVGEFMTKHHFTDIRYRGMYIWSNATENSPSNHFVVVGKKDGKEYVFDLTARQFENKGMGDLDGPLILSAEDWNKKYKDATTTKLIYYSDFESPRLATAEYDILPKDYASQNLEGKTIIAKPRNYHAWEAHRDVWLKEEMKIVASSKNIKAKTSE